MKKKRSFRKQSPKHRAFIQLISVLKEKQFVNRLVLGILIKKKTC